MEPVSPGGGGNVLKKELMVDQIRTSWNSLLGWLREAHAWSRAVEKGD